MIFNTCNVVRAPLFSATCCVQTTSQSNNLHPTRRQRLALLQKTSETETFPQDVDQIWPQELHAGSVRLQYTICPPQNRRPELSVPRQTASSHLNNSRKSSRAWSVLLYVGGLACVAAFCAAVPWAVPGMSSVNALDQTDDTFN